MSRRTYASLHMWCFYRLQGSNIEVFSLHPGVIATGLSRHMGIVHYIKCYVMSFCLKSTEQVRVLMARGMSKSIWHHNRMMVYNWSGFHHSMATPSTQLLDRWHAHVIELCYTHIPWTSYTHTCIQSCGHVHLLHILSL